MCFIASKWLIFLSALVFFVSYTFVVMSGMENVVLEGERESALLNHQI